MKTEVRSGRSPEGKLRNFKAMGYWKLYDLYRDVTREGNDSEALDLIVFYLLQWGEKHKYYKDCNENELRL